MNEDFYTVEATAEKLGIQPNTVLIHIRAGKLKAYKFGNRYYILKVDLVKTITSQAYKPKTKTKQKESITQ
jgi:excisionase family DNA binding protein